MSLAATPGTNIRGTAIIIVDIDLLSLSQNSLKEVNNVNSSSNHTRYHIIKYADPILVNVYPIDSFQHHLTQFIIVYPIDSFQDHLTSFYHCLPY